MKLELSQKLAQQQILAPQMILSMDILLLNAADLQQRVEQEFMENPALEFSERTVPEAAPQVEAPKQTESFEKVSSFESRDDYSPTRSREALRQASNANLETLQNTEGKPPGLKDYLTQQLRLQSVRRDLYDVTALLINNLDHRGYLVTTADDIYEGLGETHERGQFDEALATLRNLDPPGVGAENLKQCLLLQLERDPQNYPLETEIILNHLEDLGQNRLPKVAKDVGATLDELKDALDIIQALDPLPGARYETTRAVYVRPDVFVEEVDDELTVRVEDHQLPQVVVSKTCRQLVKDSRGNKDVKSFLRKKVESAQWLVQAIHQRQRTLYDIAIAMVRYQQDFMRKGPERIRALKMQTLADKVGVHISTVSRAIKGKYIQTPYGLYELRYFFTGGVDKANGETESRRIVYGKIQAIIESENKRRPHSDTAIARILQERGLNIARRTVTKYRESQAIPSSRLRKEY